tara:strand:+ start:325 stop:492 length:168 start_codon:yes stop_codon:yes gene_type:complete
LHYFGSKKSLKILAFNVIELASKSMNGYGLRALELTVLWRSGAVKSKQLMLGITG